MAIILYVEKSTWKMTQSNGIRIVNSTYNKQKIEKPFLDKIIALQQNLEQHRTQNFFGSLLQHQTLQATKYMSKWIESKNK